MKKKVLEGFHIAGGLFLSKYRTEEPWLVLLSFFPTWVSLNMMEENRLQPWVPEEVSLPWHKPLAWADSMSFWGMTLKLRLLWTVIKRSGEKWDFISWLEVHLYLRITNNLLCDKFRPHCCLQCFFPQVPECLAGAWDSCLFSWAVMKDFFSLCVSWMLLCSSGSVWCVQCARVHHWHSQLCLSGKCLQSNPW